MGLSREWHVSTRSGTSGNCLRARTVDMTGSTAVEIGDSKDPTGPTFTVTPSAWAAFLDTVIGVSRGPAGPADG